MERSLETSTSATLNRKSTDLPSTSVSPRIQKCFHLYQEEILKREMRLQYNEYMKIREENNILGLQVQAGEMLVKQQDYNVTYLMSELENFRKEKSELEARMKYNVLSKEFQHTSSLKSTPAQIKMLKPETTATSQDILEAPNLNSPSISFIPNTSSQAYDYKNTFLVEEINGASSEGQRNATLTEATETMHLEYDLQVDVEDAKIFAEPIEFEGHGFSSDTTGHTKRRFLSDEDKIIGECSQPLQNASSPSDGQFGSDSSPVTGYFDGNSEPQGDKLILKAVSSSMNSPAMQSTTPCPICGKNIKRNNIALHLRSHIRDRPFKCGFCDKSFAKKAVLVIHERVHTGERPFICDICQKQFADKTNYRRHRERIHGIFGPCKFARRK